jgi:hypothetical protein
MFPVLPLSPCGHADEPSIEALDEPGTVYSWTRVALGEGDVQLLAMVDFLGGSLRVIAPVADTDELAIGDQLVLTASTDHPYELRHP